MNRAAQQPTAPPSFEEMPKVDGVAHRFVRAGDIAVHVAEAGSGSPLVLMHGWPQHWYCWRHVIPALAQDFRVIVPDMRGFGWSDAPRGGYEKEELASDLFRLLDALELERVGLIGHDWGGWVGFLAALRHPERCSALVALGIVHPFQTPSLSKLSQAWRGLYQVVLASPALGQLLLRTSPALVDSMVPFDTAASSATQSTTREPKYSYGRVLQQPARARASVQMYRTFLTRELPTLHRYGNQRLTVPTRLLVGENDPVATPAMLAGWDAHADDMSVELVSGAGHFLPEEVPERVVQLAREAFATISS
jgi:pimeloyl-ACP methyl ester carboxylesterase